VIAFLFTGGTISMRLDPSTGAAVPALGAADILAQVPAIDSVTDFEIEEFARLPGPHVTPEHMWRLARRAAAWLERPDIDGLVITHGTDTIEETAYFLNLVVHSSKPVVMTASMRPSTALSADGPLNFYNAVAVAANRNAPNRGTLVVVNDWIHGASSLTKTSTTAVQTFLSPQSGLIGTVTYGVVEWYRGPVGKNTTSSEFSVDANTVLPRVDIIYATENMDGVLIDAAVAAGAKGLVIAGVGNGNMTKTALDALAAAAKRGVVCVRSTRVTTGEVGRNVEVKDDSLGFVASLGKNPQKSRVLLRLALLKTSDTRTIQRWFDEY
jgi:L-asparaginase